MLYVVAYVRLYVLTYAGEYFIIKVNTTRPPERKTVDIPIFETATNLTDVDTLNLFQWIWNEIPAVGKKPLATEAVANVFTGTLVTLFVFAFVYVWIGLFSRSEHEEERRTRIFKIAVPIVAISVAIVFLFSPGQPGPKGKKFENSIIAYQGGTSASVEEIKGTWQYKNHDFVQRKIKNNDQLKNYDMHCEDEMKIPEQEKRSIFCGGDVLSSVVATKKQDNDKYEIVPHAKFSGKSETEENPVTVKLGVEVLDK